MDRNSSLQMLSRCSSGTGISRLKRATGLLALLVASCDGPSGPRTGSLSLTITGLPPGVAAVVAIKGPGTVSLSATASQRFDAVEPGTYQIVASNALSSNSTFAVMNFTSTVEVLAGTEPTQAIVTYGVVTGVVAINLTGVPAGVSPQLTLANGSGFSRTLDASGEIGNLAPGAYTLTATDLDAGEIFAANPRVVAFTLPASTVPMPIAMSYGPITGSIQFSASGLPGIASPIWDLTGPSGFAGTQSSTTLRSKLMSGNYTVTARNVASEGDVYGPSGSPHVVTVIAGQTVPVSTQYILRPVTLNLTIANMYLTQGSQNFNGTVPLILGRNAYLRVFVRANESNAVTPSVRVRFYRGGQLLKTQSLNAPRSSVPMTSSEQATSDSWSAMIDGDLLQPGTSILTDVDPANTVREASDSDNQYPQTGIPSSLDVRPVPGANFRFVPIATGDGLVGNVTSARLPELLSLTMRMLPMGAVSADVRGPYSTSRILATADSNRAWSGILAELEAVRVAEGSGRQHIGILKDNGTGSGFAGMGYAPGRTSLSLDIPYASEVIAHELGHNWGRLHAPCGNPSFVDSAFPYPGGAIGVYGHDYESGTIMAPTTPDLMSYCRLPLAFNLAAPRRWTSDYTFSNVMAHRSVYGDVSLSSPQECLVVWGRVTSTGIVVEPAFVATTTPHLPMKSGNFRLSLLDAAGRTLTSLAFDPLRVVDSQLEEGHFAYAIPLAPSAMMRVATLAVSDGQRAAGRSVTPQVNGAAGIVAVSRRAGEVRLQWDHSTIPMLVVRDPRTREILALARSGDDLVQTQLSDLEVLASDGVRSRRVDIHVRR